MMAQILSREEILKILKAFKKKHAEKYGITNIGLFGSVARVEDRAGSDVDVVVKLKKQDLEEALHVPVDVISYREQMNAFLKTRIDRESLYV